MDVLDENKFLKIYSNDDEKMQKVGTILATPKSRKIYGILINNELNAKEVGKIVDNEENPRLPNLIFHLDKMVDAGLIIMTKKMQRKNDHILKYYKAVPIILIVPPDSLEKALKSKTLRNAIKNVFKTRCNPEKFSKQRGAMPKTEKREKNKDELFEKYQSVNHKLLDIRKKSQHSDKDGRKEVFGALRNIILYGQVTFGIMNSIDKKKLPNEIFKNVFGIGCEGKPEQTFWVESFSVLTKLVMASHANFILEAFMKSILKEMGKEIKSNVEYYKIITEVLKETKIEDT